jgi:hypothetical protein
MLLIWSQFLPGFLAPISSSCARFLEGCTHAYFFFNCRVYCFLFLFASLYILSSNWSCLLMMFFNLQHFCLFCSLRDSVVLLTFSFMLLSHPYHELTSLLHFSVCLNLYCGHCWFLKVVSNLLSEFEAVSYLLWVLGFELNVLHYAIFFFLFWSRLAPSMILPAMPPV